MEWTQLWNIGIYKYMYMYMYVCRDFSAAPVDNEWCS